MTSETAVLKRRSPAAAVLMLALTLAACVAVPVDPRTGWPVPWTPQHAPREVQAGFPPAQAAPLSNVYTARLHPVNDLANVGGLLTALVLDAQDGRGNMTLSYRSDTLSGEASRVAAGQPGFGRIHQQVLGVGEVRSAGRRGIAIAVGARAISAQCKYVLSGPAQGTGVCLFSDGAHYQLHFG